jgi:hypothetical protein
LSEFLVSQILYHYFVGFNESINYTVWTVVPLFVSLIKQSAGPLTCFFECQEKAIYCDGYLKESIPVPTLLAHTYTQVLWLSKQCPMVKSVRLKYLRVSDIRSVSDRRDSVFEATPSSSPRSSLTHEHRASETTPFPARINWSSGLSQGTTQTGAYVDVAHADVSLFIDRIPYLLVE